MRKHYLCDLENICQRWSLLLPEIKRGDRVTLFFTKKMNSMKLDALGPVSSLDILFNFIQCECGRANALDFQLVAELGRLSLSETDTEFVIVSGDQGFCSVLDFMRQRGVQVSCLNPQPVALVVDETPKESLELVTESDGVRACYVKKLRAFELDSATTDFLADAFMATMCAPANRRKLDCRNYIRAKYGAKDGEELYIKVKTLVHSIAKDGPFSLVNSKKGRLQLSDSNLKTVLQSIGMSSGSKDVEQLTEIIKKSRKASNSAQSLADRLKKHYGKDKAPKMYEALVKFL